jgi:chromosomal replication initiator protein
MKNPEDIWIQVVKEIQEQCDTDDYLTWLSGLVFEYKKDFFIVRCQNLYFLNNIKEKYWNVMQKSIHKLSSIPLSNIKLDIYISHNSSQEEKKTLSIASDEAKEIKKEEVNTANLAEIESNLNPFFSFNNFIEGRSNQLARATAIHIAQNPGKSYNPFFIYGDVGLGKTHLMHATGSMIRQLYPKARVLYLHSEKFITDVVKALEHKTLSNFKNYYRNIDALLIDDVQFLAGKDRSQEEFFYLFNILIDGQAQIILTSDTYPSEIKGVADRLKSRFGGGVTAKIEKPDLETRVAILQSKAKAEQVEISSEIAFAIAERFDTNVRELEGALRKVLASKNLIGSSINLSMITELLRDKPGKDSQNKTSIEAVQLATCNFFNISLADLLSEKRERQIARPRQIAMSLCKDLTGASLPEIGKAFGGRDHTTVLHAARKIKSLLETDTDLKEKFNQLKNKLINK